MYYSSTHIINQHDAFCNYCLHLSHIYQKPISVPCGCLQYKHHSRGDQGPSLRSCEWLSVISIIALRVRCREYPYLSCVASELIVPAYHPTSILVFVIDMCFWKLIRQILEWWRRECLGGFDCVRSRPRTCGGRKRHDRGPSRVQYT